MMLNRILVIDDLRSIYIAVRAILEPKNCVVEYAHDGETGIKMATEKQYDLILLDVHMPGLSGIEVCHQLKQLQYYEQIPILFLTSDTKNLNEGFAVGASDYILKPFNAIEIEARVLTQIKMSRVKMKLKEEKELLEKDLGLKMDTITANNDQIQSYFYHSSHKLRSPISTIQGLFQLLKMEHPEIYDNGYITTIRSWVNKMHKINQQISTVGYLNDCTPQNDTFRLDQMIDETIEEANLRQPFLNAVNKKIKLVSDIAIFKLGVLPIMQNASFYTTIKEGVAPSPELSIVQTNDKTFLSIKDYGVGMEQYLIDSVFEMFFIGDSHSQGNGLGLFIAKSAMDKLNVPITIKSENNKYTELFLDISNIQA